MDSFLHQTAVSITQHISWQQLSRTTLVLPSHRAGVVLKNELLALQQQSGEQAVWAPQVLTLQQLQDHLSPLYSEDEMMTIVRLYRLYRQAQRAQGVDENELMPLDLFYGWGRQLLADFTNIDASMPAKDVPAFFANTIAAHELEQWHLDAEVEERLRQLMGQPAKAAEGSVRSRYEQLWRSLSDIYTALRAEMEQERKGYSGMRQRSVIEHWSEPELQAKIADRTYIFVGFNYLLPVERELMQLLSEARPTLFYWDYVDGFQTNAKAFSFAGLNSGLLGNALPPRRWTEALPITAISCTSREAQAQFVHQWLRDHYTAAGQRVGVVICDETMLESVIYALPAITLDGEDQPAPVNITKGFPLRNTRIYAAVMRWLSDRARGDAEQLVSPEFIDQMLQALFPKKSDNSEAFENAEPSESSDALSWQELLVLESEYQVRKLANQMRLLLVQGLDDVPFTLKLLRLLMRRAMESVTMPFHGEPMTDIQIMGVLETRMLDFDSLLLLNVEEGVVPQRQADISFIPYYLRKTYSMQTSDERATVYAYNFFRLLSRAGHATLLFGSAETSDGGKGMSRFIMQMLVSPEFIVQKGRLQERGVLTAAPLVNADEPHSSLLESLHLSAGRLMRPSGRPYRLSPSALNTYISCPYSFYLQYILGIRPPEKEDVSFGPATLGSFVHHTLEYLYREALHCSNRSPQTVTAEQIEAVRTDEALLQQALEAAYAAMNQLWLKDHPNETDHYLFDHHTPDNILILGYVNNVLIRDCEDARLGLQIVQLEAEHTFPLPIPDLGSVEIGGTIDRLDILGGQGEQRMRVVDYKSGGYNETTRAKKMTATWEEMFLSPDKGYVRQTMMYSCAVARSHKTRLPIEPNLYFCRHKLTEQETTIVVENAPVNDVRTYDEPFCSGLATKVHELLTATSFPQCAQGECPSFCPFFDLCGRKPPTF